MLREFRDFVFRANIVELAVAFVLGVAFGALVNSFVNNLLMPVIAMVFGKPNFNDLTSRSTARSSATARSSPT
jgi:large conductance mechanosensitive channel